MTKHEPAFSGQILAPTDKTDQAAGEAGPGIGKGGSPGTGPRVGKHATPQQRPTAQP